MIDNLNGWGLLRKLSWQDVLLILAVLLIARLLVFFVRWVLRRGSEKAPPRLRMTILRVAPITRLLIGIGSLFVIVPIVVEPTFQNVVALVAKIGRAHV